MTAQETINLIGEAASLSDDELYQRLCESWLINNGKLEVWGELRVPSADNKWAGIFNVTTLGGNRELRYPVKVRKDIDSGVFINPPYAKSLLGNESSVWIECELELASSAHREKSGNPFLLCVKRNSAKRLVLLPFPKNQHIPDDEVPSYITEAIYMLHLESFSRPLTQLKTEQELEIKQSQKKHEAISSAIAELEEKNLELENSASHLQLKISAQQDELLALDIRFKCSEQEMTRKLEKLNSYISEKASFLRDLEFIDEDEFDNLTVTSPVDHVGQSDALGFSDFLNGDYGLAVSYIQAYLKERDVLYPRHIIENFLTLVRSNDLIILAGDSGSGKTNLIQSFAKAVGGVSKIIPVKPNWTSSEDLLGYYNPLEKKYLATPFLEALIEAQKNPEVPYFICLDEMNLARVEYYFADFLSKLEMRDSTPEIQLYSADESSHVLSELKAVVSIISGARERYMKDGIVDFVKLMQNENVSAEIKRAFGFGEKDSLIKYHGDIRRMLSGILGTPSVIKVPANVRIIGAINIDETTHYLSPKILDRCHIMKFRSPLLADWGEILAEIENYSFADVSKPLRFETAALGVRAAYPKFERAEPFCELFVELNKEFFDPLGVEFGMRTIRQGLHYLSLFSDVGGSRDSAVNNFIIHKVLPKFTFDGNKQTGRYTKLELIEKVMLPRLESVVPSHGQLPDEFSSISALRRIIENAKANDGVVNYWA